MVKLIFLILLCLFQNIFTLKLTKQTETTKNEETGQYEFKLYFSNDKPIDDFVMFSISNDGDNDGEEDDDIIFCEINQDSLRYLNSRNLDEEIVANCYFEKIADPDTQVNLKNPVIRGIGVDNFEIEQDSFNIGFPKPYTLTSIITSIPTTLIKSTIPTTLIKSTIPSTLIQSSIPSTLIQSSIPTTLIKSTIPTNLISTNLKMKTSTPTILKSSSITTIPLSGLKSSTIKLTTINNGIKTTIPFIISNITIIFTNPGSNATSPNKTTNVIPSNGTNLNSTNGIIRKSSSGLSAGQICAIVIPCVALLLGALLAALLLKGASTSAVVAPPMANIITPNYVDTSSLAKVNVPQEIVPTQPIESNPVINKIDTPVVNRFPMQNVRVVPARQVQAVPVQQVQMVPVQEIHTVPVQQVQMVPVQEVQTVVPVQEIVQVDVPMTHTKGLSSAVGFAEPPQ